MEMEDDDKLRPFEWLTSAQSLLPRLERLLFSLDHEKDEDTAARSYKILHLGCGSSILGELLASSSKSSLNHVVNVDCDCETIQRMENRWQSTHANSPLMSFDCLDLAQRDSLSKYPDESFDLVVDKSTLDCLLCTETAASIMIAQVYRCLKVDGCYFILSFQDIDFLKPLQQDIPGFEWQIRCDRMERSVENLIMHTDDNDGSSSYPAKITSEQMLSVNHDQTSDRRFVNILECHKRSHYTRKIDYDVVQRQVETVSNQYYSLHNPLLTNERRRQIQQAFDKNPCMDLPTCYNVLFDDHVRAHMELNEFVDDWRVFCESYDASSCNDRETMDYETAISFLEKMQ